MSADAESKQSAEVLAQLFSKLSVATPETRDAAATNVASFLNGEIVEHDVPYEFFQSLAKAIKDKKTAVNALAAVSRIANEADLSPSVEPYIVELVPVISEKAGDKQTETRTAAATALKAITKGTTPAAIKDLLAKLISQLEKTSKWQEKIALLDCISILVDTAKTQLALRMPELIPVLSEAMWDTKNDVKKAATETMTKFGY
ncbi:unnamed protein product [Ambrosiozyma monospora]|uniref:Unnamed protein product n=1 Tax=Ambrosiozyma monospora TaxID=43982 RepID=A0ACB5SZF6_AMBMO|nr:unnamed protein product [Ambrosiozyma monospora]